MGKDEPQKTGAFGKLRGHTKKATSRYVKTRLGNITQTNRPLAPPENCPQCGSNQVSGIKFNLKKRSVGKTSPPLDENYNVICINVPRSDKIAAELHLELNDIEEDLKTIEPWSPRKQHLMKILSYYVTYQPKNKSSEIADRAVRIFFEYSDERKVYLEYREKYKSESHVKKLGECMKAVGHSIRDIPK